MAPVAVFSFSSHSRQFLIKTDQINPAVWKIKKEQGTRRGEKTVFLLLDFSVCFEEKSATKTSRLLSLQSSASLDVSVLRTHLFTY
jgi:hypothetical protein